MKMGTDGSARTVLPVAPILHRCVLSVFLRKRCTVLLLRACFTPVIGLPASVARVAGSVSILSPQVRDKMMLTAHSNLLKVYAVGGKR